MHTTTHDESATDLLPIALPTRLCSVVWSRGHSYVLEGPRWVGLDGRGRPTTLTAADLRVRGWSLHPG